MSIIENQSGTGSSENSGRRKQKLKSQREDVARILKKVQEDLKANQSEDVNKIVDIGLVLARTKEGISYLFNSEPATWEILFPNEFYRQIYRLNNWLITEKSLRNRPGIVGTWTNWMIYIRFPVGTIKWLRERRIQNGGSSSGLKFHQFSTSAGRAVIIDFIRSVIDLMSKCNNWDQFKRLLAKGYGKTYQPDMFDRDEINWRPSI